MESIMRWLSILIISATLVAGNTAKANAQDNVYGITIDQDSLDILTLAVQRLNGVFSATDLKQVVSVKAKVIITDVTQSDELASLIPDMVFWTRMEILKMSPDLVSVNLTSNFGTLKLLVAGSDSVAVLPDDRVFAKVNIPEIIPASVILPEDNGGLFTLINLLGGVPFGSLFRQPQLSGYGTGMDIGFVEELDPQDIRAVIRYRGTDKTSKGLVHVITVGSALYKQYIKIWILKDTFDLYQISIEDERGTEVFVVVDEIGTHPIPAEDIFSIDISSLVEISGGEFFAKSIRKIISSPAIENPIPADLSVSLDPVARTGAVYVNTDGFDPQDNEDQLVCEIEYRSPNGPWTPLKTEYAGIAPIGHWSAVFQPDVTTELGMYSFRTRYTDRSGNTSDWLEALNILKVTPEPPHVVKTIPANNDILVPASTKISVTFSKPMNKNSVEKAFSMVSKSGRVIHGLFVWEDNTLIFSPSADLEYNTPHLLRITGEAMDTDNIGLDGNYDARSDGLYRDDFVWGFTTAKSAPVLAFVPTARSSLYRGDRFEMRIMAKYFVGMYKFSFKVIFNPEILEVEDFKRESFISWRPGTRFFGKADLWKRTVIDNSAGFVILACDGTRKNGVSGTGYVATLTFKCKGTGKSSLSFSEVSMSDINEINIPVVLCDAEIQVMESCPLDVNHDGVVDIHDFVKEGSQGAPFLAQFGLDQNFPNPFNPETWIPYQLAQPSYVTIRIYRATGELVRTLELGYKEAGFYKDKLRSAYWDGMDDNSQRVSSGIYFYTIQAGSFTATKKMLLRD